MLDIGAAQRGRAGGDAVLLRRRWRAGTAAEGAALDIEDVEGAGWCPDCGKTVPLDERFGPCPECGGYKVRMTAGDEMKIRELEVV